MAGRKWKVWHPDVNKTSLIQEIADRTDQSKSETQKFFDAFTDVVQDSLKKGEDVQITDVQITGSGRWEFYATPFDTHEGLQFVPLVTGINPPARNVHEGIDLARFFAALENDSKEQDHPYVLLLGLEPIDTVRLVEQVRKGFSFRKLDRFRENVGLSRNEMAELVQIKPRTLDRRRKEGRLQPEESDRLLRVSRVFGKAIGLFEGDVGAAKEWLSSPQNALGGAVPLEMTQTDIGAREVENLAGRLEHGVFS